MEQGHQHQPSRPRQRTRALGLPGLHNSAAGRRRLAGWLAARGQALGALAAQELEHRTPFLWLPVAFGLGILAYFAFPYEPRLWQGGALVLAALVPSLVETGWRRAVGLGLLFASLGFCAATLRTGQVATPMLARTMIVEVQGFIETLDPGAGRLRITIAPTAISDLAPAQQPKRLRIGAPAASDLRPGDFVRLRARLSPPSEAVMPGGYDFRRESFFKGIGGVGYTLGKPQAEAAPHAPPRDLAFNAWIDSGRNWLTERIATRIGGQAGALSAALITGKRGLIEEATNDDLRASGLYHIVSISGIHMVLAAGVLFWAVRAALALFPALALGWPLKKIAALFAMAGASFYCVFSGSEVATERSLIMTLVMLGAILVDRPALAMRNLALSALLVLAREPESLLGPSFQMSFAAVACLIGANRVWQGWRKHRPPAEYTMAVRAARTLLLAFLGIGATTLVATLATGPFSVFHFHRVNPFGLIGNALALPLVSLVVMPCAVIGTLLAPFDLDGIVWSLMGEGVGGVLFVAQWVGSMENASYAVPRLSAPAFAAMVLALLLFANLQTRLRALALLPLAVLILLPFHAPKPDIVVDPKGESALVRGTDGAFHLLAPTRASRFTLAQWLPALGDNRLADDPGLKQGVRCDKAGCTLALAEDGFMAVSLTPDALREDCTRATLIVTPLPAPKDCAARWIHDRHQSEKHGASFVTFEAGGRVKVISTLTPDRHRPWRREQPTDASAGLARPALAAWLDPGNTLARPDGRRLFGLLPPVAPRTPRTQGVIEEDPALSETPAPAEETPPAPEAEAVQ